MNNFDTVREALEGIDDQYSNQKWDALTALTAIEADHFSAADMASAAASGFRDGVASVQQGQEPVAWIRPSGLEMLKLENFGYATVYAAEGMSNHSAPLFAAPVAQQQEPDLTSLLFAVEQAVENGHCPWEIEAAFDEYEAARKAAPIAQQPQAETDDYRAMYLKARDELAALQQTQQPCPTCVSLARAVMMDQRGAA